MKNSAHAHSALIKNKYFRVRIAREECGHFNEITRKKNSSHASPLTEYSKFPWV